MTFEDWFELYWPDNRESVAMKAWEAACESQEKMIGLLQEALKESMAERARLVNKLAGGEE